MNQYSVLITKKAEKDITDIFDYIVKKDSLYSPNYVLDLTFRTKLPNDKQLHSIITISFIFCLNFNQNISIRHTHFYRIGMRKPETRISFLNRKFEALHLQIAGSVCYPIAKIKKEIIDERWCELVSEVERRLYIEQYT